MENRRRARKPLNDFDPASNYDSSEPAVTLHRYGKGQAIYVSGNVGAGYAHTPYPPLKRFVASLVKKNRPPLEVEAPQAIEVTAARRAACELMVHLLNHPTPMLPLDVFDDSYGDRTREDVTTFFALQEVNPVHDVRIQFNDFRVRSARLPLQGISLEPTGDPAVVIVPKVELHEVLLVNCES